MERLVIFLMVTFTYMSVNAQEICGAPTLCKELGETVRAESVPLTNLARCEDLKVKALAVPGLIISERRAAESSARCVGGMRVLQERLNLTLLDLNKERDKRYAAESKVVNVAVLSSLITAGVAVLGFVLIGVLSD